MTRPLRTLSLVAVFFLISIALLLSSHFVHAKASTATKSVSCDKISGKHEGRNLKLNVKVRRERDAVFWVDDTEVMTMTLGGDIVGWSGWLLLTIPSFYVGCPKQGRKRNTKARNIGQQKGPSPLKTLKVCSGVTEPIECDLYLMSGI